MPKFIKHPSPAPRRLIALDNRVEADRYPHGLGAALGMPATELANAAAPVARFEEHVGTSRSRRKYHPFFRGTETASHRRRSSDSYTGDVPMTRLGGKVMGGVSMLEQDAYLVMDFQMDNLVNAVAQPQRVPIFVAGRKCWWRPDALLEFSDEPPAFVEVKTIAAMHPRLPRPGMTLPELERLERRNRTVEKMRLRIAAMRRSVLDMGAQFLLLTEHQIRIQPQLDNADVMWCAMTANIPQDWVAEAVDMLCRMSPTATVADLGERLPHFADSIVMLACVLDRKGYLCLDREDFFAPTCGFVNTMSKAIR